MDQADPHPAAGPPGRPAEPERREARERPAEPERPEAREHAASPERSGPLDQPDEGQDLDHPVLAGFDGSPASRNALAYAAGMARRLERPLLVVYVTARGAYCEPLTGQVIWTASDRGELRRWLQAELEEACDASGLQVHVTTRCGIPARELAAAAADYSADALVIGASSHAWHQVIGSVPGWLARHVQCPVIVVP